MNRTHGFLVLAAVLTLAATFQPAARWLERRTQTPVVAVPRASIGGPLRLDAALSHASPLEGGTTYLHYEVRASDAKIDDEREAAAAAR